MIKDFYKIVFPGWLVSEGQTDRLVKRRIYLEIKYEDKKLSISGTIGENKYGYAYTCGQIYDTIDPRKVENTIEYTSDWNKDYLVGLINIWQKYHLNDLNANCEHQDYMEWNYHTQSNRETYKGERCPICGYSIGSKWLHRDIPESALEFLRFLPSYKLGTPWHRGTQYDMNINDERQLI